MRFVSVVLGRAFLWFSAYALVDNAEKRRLWILADRIFHLPKYVVLAATVVSLFLYSCSSSVQTAKYAEMDTRAVKSVMTPSNWTNAWEKSLPKIKAALAYDATCLLVNSTIKTQLVNLILRGARVSNGEMAKAAVR